jgi:two-component system, OmpR family, phosphate regulon sensor histidine kinase PhoR
MEVYKRKGQELLPVFHRGILGGIIMNSFGYAAANREMPDLQRASDFQAALIGMAGHDLRQPLQIIQSTYELLRNRTRGESEQAWLDCGERAIGRLSEQLNRLLDAIRLYEFTKTMEVSSVALAPLLWRLGKENKEAALQRGIDMRVQSTAAHVMSNPVLLSGILHNLTTNAVKYTEPGGRILIGYLRSGLDVRIDVYDTGIGIAPEHFHRIFDAFDRIDAARCEGLGIGLFVVRRAVELLGHRIKISSAPSQGSRFSVFAPRSQ